MLKTVFSQVLSIKMLIATLGWPTKKNMYKLVLTTQLVIHNLYSYLYTI